MSRSELYSSSPLDSSAWSYVGKWAATEYSGGGSSIAIATAGGTPLGPTQTAEKREGKKGNLVNV